MLIDGASSVESAAHLEANLEATERVGSPALPTPLDADDDREGRGPSPTEFKFKFEFEIGRRTETDQESSQIARYEAARVSQRS